MLLALSFPAYGHAALGWVALAPYFLAIARRRHRPPRDAFGPGLVTGVAAFAGTLYWIVGTMATYGGLSQIVAVGVAALLVAYLALYPALAAIAISSGLGRWGLGALALAPCAWVAAEFVRGHAFSGFPWVFLGYSQAAVIPVVQASSLGGIYLVSWMVASVSAALAYAGLVGPRRAFPWVAMVVLGTGAVAAWGAWRVSRHDLLEAGAPVRVAVVQGNVPQDQKWDPAFGSRILGRYLESSRQVASRGAALIVWPETATPFFYGEEPAGTEAIRELARATKASFLIGSDMLERGAPPRYYNAAFLVDPSGATAGTYRKIHLVPFGEYVPLKRLLFFAEPLVEKVSDFSAGGEVTMIPVAGHRASTAICYEVVFPHLAREAVRSGSELLTTITNDAWFGRSSAPYQHFEQAAVRAVEQGRFLVRAANTGISGIVDPYGRVLVRTPLFEPAAVVADVRFLQVRTLYATIGDSFVWGCVAITILLAFGTPGRARQRRTNVERTTRR